MDEVPYKDFDDYEGYNILADNSDELMENLDEMSLDALKDLQRYCNWAINFKMYGSTQSKLCNKELKPITSPYKISGKTADLIIIDDIVVNDTFTLQDFKRAQEALGKARIPQPYICVTKDYTVSYSMSNTGQYTINSLAGFASDANEVCLDCCATPPCAMSQVAPVAPPGWWFTQTYPPEANKRKSTVKEDNMLTETQVKTNYLAVRLNDTRYHKEDALSEVFNMLETRPKNAKQAREWLAGGGVVITGDDDTKYFNFNWQDPSKPKDVKGYESAIQRLTDAYRDAKDEITVKDPVTALDVLKAFEKTDFTTVH